MQCAHPTCTNEVVQRPGAGRPAKYCSTSCRLDTNKLRRQESHLLVTVEFKATDNDTALSAIERAIVKFGGTPPRHGSSKLRDALQELVDCVLDQAEADS